MKYSIVLRNGKFKSSYREKRFIMSYKLITFSEGKFYEIVDFRLYETTTRYYGCLWFKTKERYFSSSSYAGGGGYDMKQAVFTDCLTQIGINPMDENGEQRCFGGDSIESILNDIAKSLELEHYTVVVSHG